MMLPFISMLWLVNSGVVWLCATQVYSGFAWAGFNLCAGLFIWDAAPQENRTRYITLFSALGALGLPLALDWWKSGTALAAKLREVIF